MVLKNQSGSRSANRRTWLNGVFPGKGRCKRAPTPSPCPWCRQGRCSGRSQKLRYSEGLPEAVGGTQVIWDPCGEVTGFDLHFRKTKRPERKPNQIQLLPPGTWSSPCEQPGREAAGSGMEGVSNYYSR